MKNNMTRVIVTTGLLTQMLVSGQLQADDHTEDRKDFKESPMILVEDLIKSLLRDHKPCQF